MAGFNSNLSGTKLQSAAEYSNKLRGWSLENLDVNKWWRVVQLDNLNYAPQSFILHVATTQNYDKPSTAMFACACYRGVFQCKQLTAIKHGAGFGCIYSIRLLQATDLSGLSFIEVYVTGKPCRVQTSIACAMNEHVSVVQDIEDVTAIEFDSTIVAEYTIQY